MLFDILGTEVLSMDWVFKCENDLKFVSFWENYRFWQLLVTNKYTGVEICNFRCLQIEAYILVEIKLNMAIFFLFFLFFKMTIQSWSEIVLVTPKRVRA